jgi:hypothetical protein
MIAPRLRDNFAISTSSFRFPRNVAPLSSPSSPSAPEASPTATSRVKHFCWATSYPPRTISKAFSRLQASGFLTPEAQDASTKGMAGRSITP